MQLQPFPGPIERDKKGYHPVVLNRKQREWLRDVFPVTENKYVTDAMGITYPTLYRLVKKHKIRKSEEGMKAINRRHCDNHRIQNHQERLRMLSGHQQTRCFNIRMKAYTKNQLQCRYKATHFHNYIVYDGKDLKDGDPDRWKIFYDDETQRSKRFEDTCKRYGFTIEEMRE